MITAKEVYEQTMKEPYPIVDDIITNEVIPAFERATDTTVKIRVKGITDNYGIQQEFFIKQMKMRGFIVEVDCVDHPGSSPYYKITIPPHGN